jgi:hypothetical protein
MVKTGATTAVTYAVAGPIPAVANLAVSIGVDELIPEETSINEIETKTQAVTHVAIKWGEYSLYGLIAFLLITNLLTPFFTRKWGYNEAKNKYKSE